MNDLVGVRDLERVEDPAQERDRLGRLVRRPRCDGVREVHPLEQLHGHHPVAVDLIDGEHLHDVRVAKLGDDPPFALKPGNGRRIRGVAAIDDLERDRAVTREIARGVDRAHASRPDLPLQPVALPELRPGRQRPVGARRRIHGRQLSPIPRRSARCSRRRRAASGPMIRL
jgi:hypothetical protein